MRIRPASLKSRFIALAIDLFCIVLYALCLLAVTLFIYQVALGGLPNTTAVGILGMQLLGFTTLTLPVGLYFYFSESGKAHASVGKKVMGLRVVAANGKAAAKGQVALRTIIKLLPWEFAHTLVYQVTYYTSTVQQVPAWVMAGLYLANILPVVYVLTVVLRKDHRGPHDLVAGTIVTR